MEGDPGALYRLVENESTIVDIDIHLQKLNRANQVKQLKYQHPSNKFNVLMYMVANDDCPRYSVCHMINVYLRN